MLFLNRFPGRNHGRYPHAPPGGAWKYLNSAPGGCYNFIETRVGFQSPRAPSGRSAAVSRDSSTESISLSIESLSRRSVPFTGR